MQNHALRAAASFAALAALSASPLLAQTPPSCFDPNIGANLALTDDSVAVGLVLPFAFPITGSAGATTSAIDVSSNGAVYLESGVEPGSRCCNGNTPTFFGTTANIGVMWHDMNPSSAGSVHFNATATKAVVTWLGVPEFGQTATNTFQLQMFPDGSFEVLYAELTDPATHTGLVGYTPGNGAFDPGSTDFSASIPFSTGAEPSVYELITAGTGDFANRSIRFRPNATGGWDVIYGDCARVDAYGDACPGGNPATFYELFGAGTNDLTGLAMTMTVNNAGGYDVVPVGAFDPNFANNLLSGDDQLHTNLALGFSIYVPGQGGLVSAIDADSNGWCAPTGAFPGSDLSESVNDFLNLGTRWAPCWDDFNPAAGGGVYFDTFATHAMVTWDQVPQYGNTDANTFQIQFRPDGSVTMVWVNVLDDSMVGFSTGAATDSSVLDLSMDLPYSGELTPAVPLRHSASAAAAIGQTVSLILDNVPQTQLATALNLGTRTTPPFDLGLIGAPGCWVLVDALVALPMPAPDAAGRSSVSTPIPNDPNLIGVSLQTQGVYGDLVNPPNALGVGVSNGLSHVFGL